MSAPFRTKRRKVDSTPTLHSLASYEREISPPPLADDFKPTDPATFDDKGDKLRELLRPQPGREKCAPNEVIDLTVDKSDAKDTNDARFRRGEPESSMATATAISSETNTIIESSTQTIESPFRLTRIRGLPGSENEDTVGIDDILGDVMLREVWLFNYMHDIEWVMQQLGRDIVGHVKVVFVHGNWKSDDSRRMRMEKQVGAFPNAKLVAAYMPEAFGTHHTKIMVLFRDDDTAQFVSLSRRLMNPRTDGTGSSSTLPT